MGEEISIEYCKVCGEKKEKIIDFPLLDGSGRCEKRKVRLKCRCEREASDAIEKRLKHEEEQRNINELRKLSLMDSKLKDASFETYKVTQENERQIKIAENYVRNFSEMCKKSQGLLFWGTVGNGKSYTAAVIANELLNRQYSAVMTSFVKLLDKAGINDARDDNYIERINKATLLIIDDFGVERSTDYALEKVYDIIDSRYRSGKPIILTTNLTIAEMKDCDDIRYVRIYDRIFEMCYPVEFKGLSWRKRKAASRFEEMRQVLEG